MEKNGLTYRVARTDELNQVADLLAEASMDWPGDAATPIVAVRADGGIVGVGFAILAWHLDNVVALPKSGFSVSAIHEVVDQKLIEACKEAGGEAITYYTFVQDKPEALAVAAKNGMQRLDGLVPHYKTILTG